MTSSAELLSNILTSLTTAARALDTRLERMDTQFKALRTDLNTQRDKLEELWQHVSPSAPEVVAAPADEYEDIVIVKEEDLPPLIEEDLPAMDQILGPPTNSDPVAAIPTPDEMAAALNELWKGQ